MNSSVNFGCCISSTDFSAQLGLEIWLDDLKIFDQEWIKESIKLNHDFSDDDGQHVLKFVMKNKTRSHTKCNKDGTIIQDANLIISQIEFDEIDIGQIVTNLSVYEHNFNGTGAPTQDKFYEQMGCNGTVSLPFETPVYLWLLENM
jgi:hypothetical protein